VRSGLPPCAVRRPRTSRAVHGAPGRHRPGSALATSGQVAGRPRAPRADLRLVHRGIRPARPGGGAGAPRRAGPRISGVAGAGHRALIRARPVARRPPASPPSGMPPRAVYRLRRVQWVPVGVSETFSFFARPENLALITPPWLGFTVLTPGPIAMRRGLL